MSAGVPSSVQGHRRGPMSAPRLAALMRGEACGEVLRAQSMELLEESLGVRK